MSDKPPHMLGNLPPDLQEHVTKMMQQVLIIMVHDAGGEVTIPVSRIDHDTKGIRLDMEVIESGDGPEFKFKIKSKATK